jgi:hypothetical protein
MDDSRAPETPPVTVSSSLELSGPTMPGKNGGTLRRGNPGNKSHTGERSALAREILEAKTPQAARILTQMSIEGTVGRGEKKRALSDPDRLKAISTHLDRGGAPAVSAIGAAPGSGITVLLGISAQAVEDAAVETSELAPPVRAGAVPGTR